MLNRQTVAAGVAALTFACVFSLVAINERASRSPALVLAQAGPQYVKLPSFSDKQGTNRAFINKGDGKGQSTKGRVQMLADIRGSGAERRHAKNMNYVPLPEAGSMGTNKAFVNKGDGKGLRGTSKLSGFGTDAAFLHKADGSGQSTKAPTQMLASILGSGAQRRAAQAQKKHNKSGYVALPNAGAMGTNKAFVNKGDGKGLRGTSKLSGFGTDAAFLHKADGSGQSTKGRVQMLADIRGSAAAVRAAKNRNFVPLPNAGAMGTNKAFVNKGDGKGLRGTSKLSGFGTDAAFLHKADGSGQSTKGTKQMLYEWTGDMEGTYLEADPFYSGAGTKQIQLGTGFSHQLTDETNLGGIPGTEPANILPYESEYVIGH